MICYRVVPAVLELGGRKFVRGQRIYFDRIEYDDGPQYRLWQHQRPLNHEWTFFTQTQFDSMVPHWIKKEKRK